jgi:hypothetical protein
MINTNKNVLFKEERKKGKERSEEKKRGRKKRRERRLQNEY